MRNITLDQCIERTRNITDERITDPQVAMIMIMKYVGKLAENISMEKDIKAEIGYLLIYITVLTYTLQLS